MAIRNGRQTCMCYSAQILADFRTYVRQYGARIDIRTFVELYWHRRETARISLPKAIDMGFAAPSTDDERRIKAMIDEFDGTQATRFEQELFKQRKRLADAERSLQTRSTKAALESRRIAGDKIAWALGKLADLRRTAPVASDSRIYPGWYAPVMVMQEGQRVIRPMRYQCRPAGKPASYDTRYPGTYNARRDNLEGFWTGQFGVSHGLMVADAFYENVSRHALEQRELADGEKEQNVILEFRPRQSEPMLVACLYSHWRGDDGTQLLSFAAITDSPPPEIAAAGHDRCVVPIKSGNIDAWLSPDRRRLDAQYAILDDRERPYYEHRLAA
jgi:putative SOS response-associated peptidase YedK